jgi:hypothetical protein
MKIATYNLLKGGTQRVHWRKLVEGHGVELLLVQESHEPREHLPASCERAVWQAAGGNRWGSGVYSRTGVVTPVPVPGFRGWAVGAEISGAAWQGRGESVLVFSIHVPSGPGSYWGQVHKLLDRVRRLARGREVVLGGDFNILVTHVPTCDRPGCRRDLEVHRRLAEEFGLVNCWQTANPDVPPCQTLRWTGNRTIPYHCDGIFVPAGWRDRLESCDVLSGEEWNALSDHNPVVATVVGPGFTMPLRSSAPLARRG